MNIKTTHLLSLLLTSLLMCGIAHADIYKQVDAQGHVTYSNLKIKGATKLDIETPSGNTGNSENTKAANHEARKSPTPANFPKVDEKTQNQRDGTRKTILQSELDAEKTALADAKKAYEDGASNPEVYKTKDGKTMRNVPKYDEKIRALQAEIDAHQRNIELLQKEMSAM